MAIDIRATVTCSLGTLISASVSDDYVQGTGLIRTKGSCELSGIVTPAIGTAVTFSYTQDSVTRQVPRKLRVLSSFADPFRRTTKVELGCKLTYLSDLKEPVKWKPLDDPENSSITEADTDIITAPIYASSVAAKCCSELGIAGAPALSNRFSIKEFDFSAGYVSVLSDLMVSECKCGYLNTSETLVTFSLSAIGGTGPVIDSTKIIDLSSIGVGQLPGEAVTVSYSTLKLKDAGDTGGSVEEDPQQWTSNTTSDKGEVTVAYSINGGATQYKTYNTLDRTQETTNYTEITKKSSGEKLNVVSSRRIDTTRSAASVLGSFIPEYLRNGISFINNDVEATTSIFFYYDEEGNETLNISETYGSLAYAFGAVGLSMVFSASDYVSTPSGAVDFSYLIEKVVTETYTNGNYRKVITRSYGPWLKTLSGQQTIAASHDDFTTAASVDAFVRTAARGQYLIDTTIRTELATSNVQSAPSKEDRVNQANADPSGNPNDRYRVESSSSVELALGSATAQRRIELSMPYAPDDYFVKTGAATYKSFKSDAAQKATAYGRSQNRLLLGNRSGMNVQMAAPLMPAAPFAPFVVQANGLSALYRTNGTSWQMDASGILASTDALFWGAVGGTGDFWFPVAPGITTLPTAPAVVDGAMTVTSTVPTWNETVVAVARTSTKLEVTSLPYALSLLTQVAVTTRTALAVTRILKVEVPAADVNVAGVAPAVSIGVALRPPAADVAVAGAVPAVSTATVVQVPAADVAVAGATPEVSASLTVVLVPVADITVAGATPNLQAGDDYYTNLATQFFTLLRDWRVDWWGD
jgi:hypothetical protein